MDLFCLLSFFTLVSFAQLSFILPFSRIECVSLYSDGFSQFPLQFLPVTFFRAFHSPVSVLSAASAESLLLSTFELWPLISVSAVDFVTCKYEITEHDKPTLCHIVFYHFRTSDPYFQRGWVYFRSSLYFISSLKKPWQESRVDCLQQGADLVIINSREEQDFIRKFYGLIWIGLTRRGHNGTWRWVDGTPLTKSYWSPGEPNEFEGKKEDCVEIKHHEMDDSWNDIPCEDQNFWICEKMVAV
uniref:CD209 antigen-like protein A n=1 Tax=Labrus bergylta TaxID=56723 RepID=A0A3Q3F6G7_9LABR